MLQVDETTVLYKRFLALILSHQRWSVVRCTIRMMSIWCPSELVQVTEIFSKSFVMGCVLLQQWQSTMRKRNGWMEYIPRYFSVANMVGCQKVSYVSCFRYFDYSNVTLVKSGNSMLKCHTQLWLLEAAWDDTSTMLTQIHEFNSFLNQVTSSSSKGPCF